MERQEHKAVGWCEKDKFAQKSYKTIHNTEGEWFANEITDVQPGELPEADVYCGGFPCQSFSIAGERGGFDDIRGTLIFEVLRLAKERQPKYLFLENVKGLLNHDKGATFSTILKSMADVGYDAEWQVLNSKDFSTRERPTPQNRERVFIIGHFRGRSTKKVFPIRRKNSKTIRQSGNIVDDSDINFKNPQRGRVYNPKGISPTLNCMEGGGLEAKIVEGLNTTEEGDSYCIDSNYHKGTSPGDINSGRRTHIKACLTPERINKKQNGRRFKEPGEPMFTLTGQDIHGVGIDVIGNTVPSGHSAGNVYNPYGLAPTVRENHGKVTKTVDNMRIRKLTPKECWRLQGFPDWAFEKAAEVNSDTQLYKQAGNSVTVNVIEEIAKRLKLEGDGNV